MVLHCWDIFFLGTEAASSLFMATASSLGFDEEDDSLTIQLWMYQKENVEKVKLPAELVSFLSGTE